MQMQIGTNYNYSNSTTQLDQGYGSLVTALIVQQIQLKTMELLTTLTEQGNGKALSEWTGNGVTLTHNTSENKGVLGSALVPCMAKKQDKEVMEHTWMDYIFQSTGNTNTRIEDQATLSL